MTEPEDLLREIRSAFAGTRKPKAAFKTQIAVQSDIITEIQSNILGKDWQDVSLQDWLAIGAPIASIATYVTPQAFAYYLPSLLVGSINTPSHPEFALQALVPSNAKREVRGDWWPDLVACFDQRQIQAVALFIRGILNTASRDGVVYQLGQKALLLWSG